MSAFGTFGSIIAFLALFAAIIIIMIVLFKLINGQWLLAGGPAVAVSAITYSTVLKNVDSDKEYRDAKDKPYTAKPKHAFNIYKLEGPADSVLVLEPKHLRPGMEVRVQNLSEGKQSLLVNGKKVALNSGETIFEVDEKGTLPEAS